MVNFLLFLFRDYPLSGDPTELILLTTADPLLVGDGLFDFVSISELAANKLSSSKAV